MSKYFSVKELSCPCCGKANMDMHFVEALDRLREAYGKPLSLSSGYRCAEHNRAVGGAAQSQHLQGNAVDIPVSSKETRYQLVKLALLQGFTGIECSPVHVHLDRRSGPAIMFCIDAKRNYF